MPEITFDELSNQIQQHFAQESYTDGLSLASKHLADFPEAFALINYWRICMASLLGEKALANKILESTLASGLWYADVLLRQSSALAAMQGDPEFEKLVQISKKLHAADGMEAPLLVARPENACGPEDVGCPSLFFLHNDMDSAQNSIKQLGALSSYGWVVAAPQSSQSMYTGAYMWIDFPTTQQEVGGHLENLSQRVHLSSKKIVHSGLGRGAELALEIALNGDLPARGFVLLSPGGQKMDDVNEWLPLIDKAAGKSLRGTIVLNLDEDQENAKALAKMLNEHNIPTKLITFQRAGQDFPENAELVFKDALDFVIEEEG